MDTAEDVNKSQIQTKKRRKRREKKNILKETVDVNDEKLNSGLSLTESAMSDPGSNPHRKRRRKREKQLEEGSEETGYQCFDNPIHQHVSQLKDDIVDVSDEPLPSSPHTAVPIWHTNVGSCPSGQFFVEYHRGVFKAIDRNQLEKLELKKINKSQQNGHKLEPSSKAVSLALWMHLNLQKLSNCSQGIFAGFSICLLIIIYRMQPPYFTFGNWLTHYSTLALPVESSFYLLSVICLWTLIARCNIGGEKGNVWEQMKYLNTAILAIVIYFVTLLLTLSVTNVDMQMNLVRASNDSGVKENYKEEINRWTNVNLCRCLGAIVAWIILCIAPPIDYNRNFLEKINVEASSDPQIKNESA